MMVLAANAARIHQKEKENKAARRRQAKSSQPSKARNSSRNATNSSKAPVKGYSPFILSSRFSNEDDVRPSTKVRRTSTGIKRKVLVKDKSTDGDDNNDSYDHQRKVKSASEDMRCTRARRQRGSSGSKKKQELLEEEVSKDEKSEDEQDDATSAREDDDNDNSEIEDD
ncbi:hypothetical protein VaNZ11_015245 [Volvox africanus]|uniref:Uncharacterized protein n=1 Tax=Volvox africanus TaxID=51714 RepID=A0ABQ5SKW7_9CHLO|nr:hypothetical protein VaNZ11_015245 [Volvox africanus]